jgi:hypothetical protein
MEEGKIATWLGLDALKSPSMYIRMRVLGVTLLLAWGRLGSISAPFGEPASRFTSAIERSNMEEGKIATAWHSLVRLKEVHHVYKNACYLGNTFC